MEGHVTEVHKPLACACEISKYHDAFIFEEFGALIRRHSRVAEGLRRKYPRMLPASLLSWNSTSVSTKNIAQLNIVQLPLQTCKKLEMAPVEPNQEIVMNAPENTCPSSSGNAPQAQKL